MAVESSVSVSIFASNNFNRNYRFSFFTISGGSDSFQVVPTIEFEVIPDITTFIINSVNFSFSYSVASSVTNTISLKFYNLSQTLIGLFTGSDNKAGFSFEAWYGSLTDQQFNKDFDQGSTTIFRGLTYTVNTYREGPDIITEIVGCDFFTNLQAKSFNQTYPPGTTALQIVQDVMKFYGGTTTLNTLSEQFLTKVYTAPKTIIGQANTVLRRIAADSSLIFSNQLNTITMVPRSLDFAPSGQGPIYINNANGLVGYVRATSLSVQAFPVTYLQTPSLNNNLSLIQVTTLLRHYNIYDLVNIESEQWNGDFRILSLVQTGEWRGNSWYSNLTLQPEASNPIPGTF